MLLWQKYSEAWRTLDPGIPRVFKRLIFTAFYIYHKSDRKTVHFNPRSRSHAV